VLTTGLILGLIISYLPQHLRIIQKRSSEGLSPWFLLLGSTASAAAMLNMITVQWEIIKCCREISAGYCIESLGGIIQVALTWFLFTLILVLYIIYFPQHLKYAELNLGPVDHPIHVKTRVRSDPWRLAITLSWAVAIHIVLVIFVTFLLLLSHADPTSIQLWAAFLGITSSLSAVMQYFPQIDLTWRSKTVGALSIPMMCIQSPGAVIMVVSIAIRPGTDWTSWAPFAVAGVMQGTLLIMCLFWKVRQARLGIDDFGRPLGAEYVDDAVEPEDVQVTVPLIPQETTPLLSGNQRS